MENIMVFGTSGPLQGRALRGPLASGQEPRGQGLHTEESAAAGDERLDLTRYESSGRPQTELDVRPTGRQSPFEVAPPHEEQGGQLVLPAVPRGVPLSRQLVREICRLLDLDSVADLAELLASEVVTNAVLHAHTHCLRIVVEARQGELVVSVADSDNKPPTMREHGPDSVGGRGLHLLDSLADSWGVTEWPDGKAVWFTLATPAPPGALPGPP